VELDKLQDKFFSFVKDNPGLRIEQINKQLGTSTKDLALPIRKLIAEGEIKAKGEKRSTTYFASEGGRKKKKS
jgi:predicted transcriptional regulator